MKVLQENHANDLTKPQVNLTCRECKSVLEVSRADVKSIGRNEEAIECPICHAYNNPPITLYPDKLAQAFYEK